MNPIYYVTFTTATLVASFILYKGFNTSDAVNTISLLCGFLIIFAGVYLLNLSREDPEGDTLHGRGKFEGVPTDGIASLQTRRSMQARRSMENGRVSSGSYSARRSAGDREGLMQAYDVEAAQSFGLGDLAEESDEEMEPAGKRTSFDRDSPRERLSMPAERDRPRKPKGVHR